MVERLPVSALRWFRISWRTELQALIPPRLLRRRALPEGVDFWDFDCKFGTQEEDAKQIHLAEITSYIDNAEKEQLESFYVEVVAKPGLRMKKTKPQASSAPSTGTST